MHKLLAVMVATVAAVAASQGAFAASKYISKQNAAKACSVGGGEWECFDSSCSSATCSVGNTNITCSAKKCVAVTGRKPTGATNVGIVKSWGNYYGYQHPYGYYPIRSYGYGYIPPSNYGWYGH